MLFNEIFNKSFEPEEKSASFADVIELLGVEILEAPSLNMVDSLSLQHRRYGGNPRLG